MKLTDVKGILAFVVARSAFAAYLKTDSSSGLLAQHPEVQNNSGLPNQIDYRLPRNEDGFSDEENKTATAKVNLAQPHGTPLQSDAQPRAETGGASRGYSPASPEVSQFVILCVITCILALALMLLASSCYSAHHQRTLPISTFLYVLGEKRTMRLLIIPALATITTLTMTWFSYKWYHHSLDLPLSEVYFISQVVNFPRVEPWSSWLARWAIWFLVIFGVVEFKGEILPWSLMWLPVLWGIALVLVIVSGIHQYDVTDTYSHPVWGIEGSDRFDIHSLNSTFAFFVCWLESVMFWWPNRIFHVLYGCLILSFIVSFVGVKIFPAFLEVAMLLEWLVLGLHLVIVWYRAPIITSQMEQGAYTPWVGCCKCCCPYVDTLEGTICCPPLDSGEGMDIVGAPTAISK